MTRSSWNPVRNTTTKSLHEFFRVKNVVLTRCPGVPNRRVTVYTGMHKIDHVGLRTLQIL